MENGKHFIRNINARIYVSASSCHLYQMEHKKYDAISLITIITSTSQIVSISTVSMLPGLITLSKYPADITVLTYSDTA